MAVTPCRYASSFRLGSDGSITNIANGLQLAQVSNGKLTFIPRLGAGVAAMGACPTRALVLATPPAVRSQLWEFESGCKTALDVMTCHKRAADGLGPCDLTTAGCFFGPDECGGGGGNGGADMTTADDWLPCCAHPMPSTGSEDAQGKSRYELYMRHVGQHYYTQWDTRQLLVEGVLRLGERFALALMSLHKVCGECAFMRHLPRADRPARNR